MATWSTRIYFKGTSRKFMNVPNAGYAFISVINDFNASVVIYRGRTVGEQLGDLLFTVRPLWQRTFPISSTTGDITFDITTTDPNLEGYLDVILSSENMNLNDALSGDVTADVTLVADNVGLAKEDQFPTTLDNGNLRVSVQNEISAQITEALPAGTSTIGAVLIKDGEGDTIEITQLGDQDGNSAGRNTVVTGSYLLGFNGTSWDRLKVDAQDNLFVTIRDDSGDQIVIGSLGNQDGNSASSKALLTGSFLLGFNGTTFDRLRVDANRNLMVNSPQETMTTSTELSATTTLDSYAFAGAVGYLVQADPDNTDNIRIINSAMTVLKMIPGQVNVVMLPGFDYVSVSGTQAINVTAIERV
jgi:hypothetical protein